MSHKITKKDSLMSVREMPWHGIGSVLDKHPKTIEAAVKASGLDWEVIQVDAKMRLPKGKLETVEGYKVNVRKDTGDPLGIVSTRYKPVQNIEAFSFLASVFGSEMLFETAGSLMGGRRVWVMMKLPDFISVGGDPIGQYAFISNSHDGKTSVVTALTPIRIVCANTLNMALHQVKGVKAKRSYVLRHIGDIDSKIIEARNVLQVTVDYYKAMKKVGDGLARAKVTDKKAEAYLAQLFPINDSMGDRTIEAREETRERVMSIFKGLGHKGDTSGNAPGTYWCLYNSAAEYLDWERGERKEGGRWQRALDDPDGSKKRAWELIIDQSGLKAGSKNKAVVTV